jgi:hypothetical protein
VEASQTISASISVDKENIGTDITSTLLDSIPHSRAIGKKSRRIIRAYKRDLMRYEEVQT